MSLYWPLGDFLRVRWPDGSFHPGVTKSAVYEDCSIIDDFGIRSLILHWTITSGASLVQPSERLDISPAKILGVVRKTL